MNGKTDSGGIICEFDVLSKLQFIQHKLSEAIQSLELQRQKSLSQNSDLVVEQCIKAKSLQNDQQCERNKEISQMAASERYSHQNIHDSSQGSVCSVTPLQRNSPFLQQRCASDSTEDVEMSTSWKGVQSPKGLGALSPNAETNPLKGRNQDEDQIVAAKPSKGTPEKTKRNQLEEMECESQGSVGIMKENTQRGTIFFELKDQLIAPEPKEESQISSTVAPPGKYHDGVFNHERPGKIVWKKRDRSNVLPFGKSISESKQKNIRLVLPLDSSKQSLDAESNEDSISNLDQDIDDLTGKMQGTPKQKPQHTQKILKSKRAARDLGVIHAIQSQATASKLSIGKSTPYKVTEEISSNQMFPNDKKKEAQTKERKITMKFKKKSSIWKNVDTTRKKDSKKKKLEILVSPKAYKPLVTARDPFAILQQLQSAEKRHESSDLKRSKCIISADSTFRQKWDNLILLACIYILIVVPAEIGFLLTNHVILVFGAILDVIFFIDIVLNFMTSYYDESTKHEIFEAKKIAQKYVKEYFWLDLIGCIPIDFTLLWVRLPLAHDLLWVKILRLLKVSRVHKFNKTISDVEKRTNNIVVTRLCKLIIAVLFSVHFVACLYWHMGGVDSFEGMFMDSVPSFWDEYSHALYFSFGAMTGNIVGTESTLEGLLVTFCLVVGIMINATIIGSATTTISQLSACSVARKQQIDGIKEYMRKTKMPTSLQKRIYSYYEYLWDIGQSSYHKAFLHDLPPKLRMELNVTLKKHVLEICPLLTTLRPEGAILFVEKTISQIVLPGDLVIDQGERADAMFFIARGSASVFHTKGNIAQYIVTLKEGSCFGESGLMSAKAVRNCSVVAETFCELMVLKKEDFRSLCEFNPKFKAAVKVLRYKRKVHRNDLVDTALGIQENGFTRKASLGHMSITEMHRQRERSTSILKGLPPTPNFVIASSKDMGLSKLTKKLSRIKSSSSVIPEGEEELKTTEDEDTMTFLRKPSLSIHDVVLSHHQKVSHSMASVMHADGTEGKDLGRMHQLLTPLNRLRQASDLLRASRSRSTSGVHSGPTSGAHSRLNSSEGRADRDSSFSSYGIMSPNQHQSYPNSPPSREDKLKAVSPRSTISSPLQFKHSVDFPQSPTPRKKTLGLLRKGKEGTPFLSHPQYKNLKSGELNQKNEDARDFIQSYRESEEILSPIQSSVKSTKPS